MIEIWKRLVLPVLLAGFSLSALAAETHDRLLLRLQEGVDETAFLQRIGERFARDFVIQRRLGYTLVLNFTPALPRTGAADLAVQVDSLPEVMYAQLPGGRLQPQFVPNDALYPNQWHLFDTYGINAQEAWDRTRGSSSVVIAQVDTGILGHEDLDSGRVLPGYDFVSDPFMANDGDGMDADPTDPGDAVAQDECGNGNDAADSSWHGLLVAGIMLATADNTLGVVGVDHRARLLPVRAFGRCGGDFVDILTGMSWAAGLPVTDEADNPIPDNPNPADVINLSFAGSGSCDPVIQDIIDQIRARGVVLVAAAGNEGMPDMSSVLPANCTGVIAVAATTRTGDRAGYSNYGAEIEISAPGGEGFESILTLHNTGDITAEFDDYAAFNGTSMAAAQVSAAVALMRAVDGDVSPATVTSLLINSAQPFPGGSTCATTICGAGILDLDAALQQVAQSGSAAVDSGGGGCMLAGQDRHDLGLTLLLTLLLVGRLAGRRASNP
ncbi:subtilisin-like serine proteases [Thiohalobacter thiocyanaticus]|uniref:Subtilisin-like serine proteases n=1 Tax=Thiohalobacter thiocyanaticus TaxID=585455 RepID=A0A1Z4VR78_9GAMM|nr:S8 family peptidase [Thiohalobacter thiocyanaticus]BAZ93985.1 subtilisin-like serine proteases [Thiohalobacter thiocyanaticus]